MRGQSVLASTLGHVETVRLDPPDPPARHETIEAVAEADVLNLGPGSWYTSVMPHLLVPSLASAIERSSAVKSLTLNLGSSDGETRDLSLSEHLMSLHRHAPSLELSYVLVDEAATLAEPELERCAREMFNADSGPVHCTLAGQDSMTASSSPRVTVTCWWTPGSAWTSSGNQFSCRRTNNGTDRSGQG